MTKYRYLGHSPVDFVSSDGKPVKGINLYISFPDENVVGEKCERFFVKSSIEIPAQLKIGDMLEIEFDHKGKVRSIAKK